MSRNDLSFQDRMIEIQLENQRMMSEWLAILQKIDATRVMEIHDEKLPPPVDPRLAELAEVKKNVYLTAAVVQALATAFSSELLINSSSIISDEIRRLLELRQRQMVLESELSSRNGERR